jgi:hypothetical protein
MNTNDKKEFIALLDIALYIGTQLNKQLDEMGRILQSNQNEKTKERRQIK